MIKRLLGAASFPVLVGCSLSLLLGACGGGADGSAGNSTNGSAGTGSARGGSPGSAGSSVMAPGGAPSAQGGTPNGNSGGAPSVGGGAPSSGGTVGAAGTSGGGPTGGTSSGGTSSGGTSSGGTSSGGTSSGGTNAGGSGAGPCGVSPVTPNATQQTKNLLCYLYSIKGNHVLSGQQEANWNTNPTDIAWYPNNGMKYPAVLGSDFLYRGNASCTSVTASTTRAIAYWNAGGLTMFRYHMGMPGAGLTCSADCFSGANCAEPTTKPTAAFFNNVVTAGTAENTSLNSKLDYVAVQISAMKAANVPVILAIYHETQPNGWFWWAETASGPAFIKLWTYTFDYLTKTKGLTNIIWLMPFSGSPNAGFYPGKAFADVAGPDEYTKPSNLLTFNASGNYNPALTILGNTIPITLHETGSALQPDSIFPSGTAPWILWNVWATYENTLIGGVAYNTVASMQAAYASQYTITRDEVPNLK